MPSFNKADFIEALDSQNVETVEDIINSFPDEDYNAITESGLSALWVALSPPKDANISVALVTLLAQYVRNDGSPLINPTQAHAGFTPRQHLAHLEEHQTFHATNKQDIRILSQVIGEVENNYVARANQQGAPRGLGAIAQGAQNAHDSTVAANCRENITRLYQHYAVKQNKPLTQASFNALEEAIAKVNPKSRAEQIQKGLLFCLRSTTSFKLNPNKSDSARLTMSELLALLHHAIDDDDKDMEVEGQSKKEDHETAKDIAIKVVKTRQDALIESLYDIATAYGKNRPSCKGGAYNRLGSALTATHQLVRASSEPVTGEAATLMITHYLGKQLQVLCDENMSQYWQVMRYQLLGDSEDEQNTKAFNQFIDNNSDSWKRALMAQNIDKADIDIALNAAKGIAFYKEKQFDITPTLPTESHLETWQFVTLLDLYAAKDEKWNVTPSAVQAELKSGLSLEDGVTKVIDYGANQLHSYDVWHDFLTNLDIKPTKNLTTAFMQQALICGRTNEQLLQAFKHLMSSETSATNILTPSTKKEDGRQHIEDIKGILLITHFHQQKSVFLTERPEQADWIKHLSDERVLALLKPILNATSKSFPWNNLHTLFDAMVKQALHVGCLSGLSCQGITFDDENFRGFCFDGVNLDGATFKNCDLRLASFDNVNLGKVEFEHCLSSSLYQDDILKMNDNKAIVNLFVDFAKTNNTVAVKMMMDCCFDDAHVNLLVVKDNYGWTALMHAALHGHTETVKAFLESGKCTADALVVKDNNNYRTALMLAALKGHTETVKAFLESGKCTADVLVVKDYDRCTALMNAALHGHTETVKALLESGKCTTDVLVVQNRWGNTALMLAAENGRTETVKAFLESGICTADVWRLKVIMAALH